MINKYWNVPIIGIMLVASIGLGGDLATQLAYEKMEHRRLYTEPDPSAVGGIQGRIANPAEIIRQVLAIPAARPEKVYRGEFTDSQRRSFYFKGLPMDRYDLVVIYENAAYEGLRLHRGESTLTRTDLQQIQEIIERSESFFTLKIIHRLEGDTGRGNQARAFVTMARDLEAEMYAVIERFGYRRTHKLVILQQVGPGWQIVRTRDLYPVWVEFNEKNRLRPTHHFRSELSGIRVTHQVRDLGEISL